ncbi:MAG: Gx transporter family protein [Oscillospiraceae bacterium]|jgi:heptaprenyl diphosphate synthase|nr:Gx transporter family protein [Oscillospiraceae bacterium]
MKSKSNININARTRFIALLGILGAQAIVLSLLENFIPPVPGLPPGAKLGFSNIVTMFTASTMGFMPALYITVIKAVFAGATRGSAAFFMSFAGGVLSTAVMSLLLKSKRKTFGIIGIAVLSAAAHNLGQLIVAAIISGTSLFVSYAPFLLIYALITGCLTGSMLKIIMPALQRQSSFFKM